MATILLIGWSLWGLLAGSVLVLVAFVVLKVCFSNEGSPGLDKSVVQTILGFLFFASIAASLVVGVLNVRRTFYPKSSTRDEQMQQPGATP
jgi:hypothetical protein